jgi:hypothetical protein
LASHEENSSAEVNARIGRSGLAALFLPWTSFFMLKLVFVSIPFLGAVVVKGSSVNCVGVDVVLECGEVRALACEVGRELSTFQYERTG